MVSRKLAGKCVLSGFRFFIPGFSRGVECGGPDPIRRIGSGLPRSASQPTSVPEHRTWCISEPCAPSVDIVCSEVWCRGSAWRGRELVGTWPDRAGTSKISSAAANCAGPTRVRPNPSPGRSTPSDAPVMLLPICPTFVLKFPNAAGCTVLVRALRGRVDPRFVHPARIADPPS